MGKSCWVSGGKGPSLECASPKGNRNAPPPTERGWESELRSCLPGLPTKPLRMIRNTSRKFLNFTLPLCAHQDARHVALGTGRCWCPCPAVSSVRRAPPPALTASPPNLGPVRRPSTWPRGSGSGVRKDGQPRCPWHSNRCARAVAEGLPFEAPASVSAHRALFTWAWFPLPPPHRPTGAWHLPSAAPAAEPSKPHLDGTIVTSALSELRRKHVLSALKLQT